MVTLNDYNYRRLTAIIEWGWWYDEPLVIAYTKRDPFPDETGLMMTANPIWLSYTVMPCP